MAAEDLVCAMIGYGAASLGHLKNNIDFECICMDVDVGMTEDGWIDVT